MLKIPLKNNTNKYSVGNSDVQISWLIRKNVENVNEEKGESLISINVHVIRSRLIETVYKYI